MLSCYMLLLFVFRLNCVHNLAVRSPKAFEESRVHQSDVRGQHLFQQSWGTIISHPITLPPPNCVAPIHYHQNLRKMRFFTAICHNTFHHGEIQSATALCRVTSSNPLCQLLLPQISQIPINWVLFVAFCCFALPSSPAAAACVTQK
uniref:(northern house mosquito) hypothetical protein n=1 Tax=Culex pipiens TaxID=7175 RepID=A0A8D8BB11_CULPI